MVPRGWNLAALAAGALVFAVGGPWLWSQLRSLPDHGALAARAQERVVTLEVGGMTCAGCAAKVRGEIAALPGVSEAMVRLAQDRAYVVCDSRVSDSSLVAAVRHAGPGFLAAVVPK